MSTTTTSAPICRVDMVALASSFPTLQEGAFIGWIEKDGLEGYTSEEEMVTLGESIEDGMLLHVNCNNCTCDESVLECSDEECVQNCIWSPWSEWSECDQPCDGGETSRTRTVDVPSSGGGESCAGDPSDEVLACNTAPCPVDGDWSTWSPWSTCTATCDGGVMERVRDCSDPAPQGTGSDCVGGDEEQEQCNQQPCEQNVCTQDNMEWVEDCKTRLQCPLTCDHARGSTTECVEPESCEPGCYCLEGMVRNDEGVCMELGDCTCEEGDSVYNPGTVITNTEECEVCMCVDAVMQCEETEECNVDCGYTEWSDWSECSKECDTGIQSRTRDGDSPAAQGNGAECTEELEDSRICNDEPCPMCTDSSTGIQYDMWEVVESFTCYYRVCNDNLEIVNQTIDNEACYPTSSTTPTTTTTTTPPPSEECQLTTVNEVISFRNADDELCESDGPVSLTVCSGACSSYDSSPMMFKENPDTGYHSYECKCCTYTDSRKRVETVSCNGVDKKVEVLEFTGCGCNLCSAGGNSEAP